MRRFMPGAPRVSPCARAALARRAFVVALALLALAALLPAAASASKSQWSIFEDHPYLVRSDPATREKALDEITMLGADTIRVEIKWSEVAPNPASRNRPQFDATDPSAYPGFGPYDALVQSLATRKLRILMTITGDAPRWATAGDRGENYKPDPVEYARFVSAVGTRYSGTYNGLPKIVFYTIWNEPNHINFIKPTSQAPRIYRKLVDAAIPALRAKAAPEAKIFVGELKPTPRKGLGPATFMQQWLCLDTTFRKLRGKAARRLGCTNFKKIDADGFAHHPYGPIEIISKKRDIINLLAIRRLGKDLDLAAKANRLPRHLPIYDTEFGIQTNPPDIFVATSPARQAALINQKEEFAYRYARLKSHSQYQLYDDPSRPGPPAIKWSGFQTGLRFNNGREKPSYEAYRFPLVVRKLGKGVVIWGRVRPGVGGRFAQLQKLSGGGFVNVGSRLKTNSLGYFTLKQKTGTYRFLAYGELSTTNPGTVTPAAVTLLGRSRAARPSL
jgi:hypothetical protein